MCSQFLQTLKPEWIREKLGVLKPQFSEKIDYRVRGFIKTDLAPVIFGENGKLEAREMMFSLCPSWAKEFPCKWSTYNARMDRPPKEFIYQVPTWRDSFNKGQTCLVPMTAAVESSYFGTHAGQIIQFSQKNSEIFLCAGLRSTWIDKSTGEIKDTFALITDDPYPFFFQSGHDRSVVVLPSAAANDWLLNQKMTGIERFQFLRKNRIDLDWQVKTERAMAKGWEKKAPTEKEIQEIKVWKSPTLLN